MERIGMNMVLGALVALMVMLSAAAVISFGFGSNYQGVMDMVSGNTDAKDIELCQTNVERYCNNNDAGEDWGSVYTDCTDYSEDIDADGDTSCPLD